MRLLLISASALMLAACSETTPAASAPAAPAPEAAAPAADVNVEYGAAGTYAIDPTHTSVTWRVDHFGSPNTLAVSRPLTPRCSSTRKTLPPTASPSQSTRCRSKPTIRQTTKPAMPTAPTRLGMKTLAAMPTG